MPNHLVVVELGAAENPVGGHGDVGTRVERDRPRHGALWSASGHDGLNRTQCAEDVHHDRDDIPTFADPSSDCRQARKPRGLLVRRRLVDGRLRLTFSRRAHEISPEFLAGRDWFGVRSFWLTRRDNLVGRVAATNGSVPMTATWRVRARWLKGTRIRRPFSEF